MRLSALLITPCITPLTELIISGSQVRVLLGPLQNQKTYSFGENLKIASVNAALTSGEGSPQIQTHKQKAPEGAKRFSEIKPLLAKQWHCTAPLLAPWSISEPSQVYPNL